MDKKNEADDLAELLIPALASMSHNTRIRLGAAVAEDNERCVRELQLSRSPTRKMRNGNGAAEQPEASS
jgi:dsDNA-binding SOS-regulon protein